MANPQTSLLENRQSNKAWGNSPEGQGHSLVTPRFSTPCDLRFFPLETGETANFRGFASKWRRFPCVAWQNFVREEKKQYKHKLFGPDFSRTFLTLTPGCPGVKKFLPATGAAGKRTLWCGRPRFSGRTSMTRRVVEKLCTEDVCVDFLAPNSGKDKTHKHKQIWEVVPGLGGWQICVHVSDGIFNRTRPKHSGATFV